MLDDALSHAVAGLCAFSGLLIALVQILCHLRYYTEPLFQRYIVRIIFLVPVYALASFLALLQPEDSVYFDSARDCYEAWVIYNFLALLLAYVGGPGAVEVKMSGYVLAPSVATCTCCIPPMPVNGKFVKTTKRMTLQFVLLKPFLATLTVVLFATGHYIEGDWVAENGYLWIQLTYNVTYTVALYGLLLFYMGTHTLLAPFKPLLKFIMIKTVVFLTFWQGVFISILVATGVIESTSDGKNLQNFLICVEMLPAAAFLCFAFPYSIYSVTGSTTGLKKGNVTHAISIRDVLSDTVHHFAPVYNDYVLYSDGSSQTHAKGKQTIRTRSAAGLGPVPEGGARGILKSMELSPASKWRTTEEGIIEENLAALHSATTSVEDIELGYGEATSHTRTTSGVELEVGIPPGVQLTKSDASETGVSLHTSEKQRQNLDTDCCQQQEAH